MIKTRILTNINNVIITIVFLSLLSCDDKNNTSRNQWVTETMETWYLWEDKLPDNIDPKSNENTFDFFESLLYPEDHWSFISDDYFGTRDYFDAITTTAGHEFALYYKNAGDYYNVKGIVEFVMSGSPAEEAGIKRGDTFTRINGTSLNIDNYIDLLTSYTNYTIGFDTLKNGSLSPAYTITIIEIEDFQENPIYIDTVYEINGYKIGYLMYNQFVDKYNDAKTAVFEKFKRAGITDLILDLRYNNGGKATAEVHLANLIAPIEAEDKVFAADHWNKFMTQYFSQEYGEDFFYTYIKRSEANINLQGKLIALTSSTTASASEGLLNGLAPFVDLELIGDTTHGKYTGMIVIPDQDSIWAIVPIVVEMTNKENTSVKGGMVPTVLLDDNPMDGFALGDMRETMLAKAIERITGGAITRRTIPASIKIGSPFARFRHKEKLQPIPTIVDLKGELYK